MDLVLIIWWKIWSLVLKLSEDVQQQCKDNEYLRHHLGRFMPALLYLWHRVLNEQVNDVWSCKVALSSDNTTSTSHEIHQPPFHSLKLTFWKINMV
jgi:hypothetical protein